METPGSDPFDRLSPRQRECLRLTYNRKRTKEIAALLGLSVGTVGTYCTEAIRILDARDRIDAAERLHAWELQKGTPQGLQPSSVGVAETDRHRPAEVGGQASPGWRRFAPFRTVGASQNDLGILARLLWIPVVALAFAAGFGMLAEAVRITSDIVAGRSPR